MSIVAGGYEVVVLRYWKASRAWKGIDAIGWTVGDLIETLTELSCARLGVGPRANDLLQDVIHDHNYRPLDLAEDNVKPLRADIHHQNATIFMGLSDLTATA
jgi:hypothetical protein